jgi:hypothetical protein
MQEQWRQVEGWPYEVSDHGRVRRSAGGRTGARKGKILSPGIDKHGYGYVHLSNNPAKKWYVKVSILVCTTFHGDPPPGKPHACHNDGVPLNNYASNLRWGSPKENAADRIRHGTYTCGEKHSRATLSQSQVDNIRNAYRAAREGRERVPWGWPAMMSARYGVSAGHINLLCTGMRWKNPPAIDHPRALTAEGGAEPWQANM